MSYRYIKKLVKVEFISCKKLNFDSEKTSFFRPLETSSGAKSSLSIISYKLEIVSQWVLISKIWARYFNFDAYLV